LGLTLQLLGKNQVFMLEAAAAAAAVGCVGLRGQLWGSTTSACNLHLVPCPIADQSNYAATYSSWVMGMKVKVDHFVVQIGEANILQTREHQHQSKGGVQQ
jgi:hypothetical protein